MQENFDWKTYILNYKDLRDAAINTQEKAWGHWVMWGNKEGRTFDKIENIDYDLYIPTSDLANYFVLNNCKYIDVQQCLTTVNWIVKNYTNHFDVDTHFYSLINNLNNKSKNDILVDIYNNGVINGLIYHQKQLLNIFPDIKIKESNNKIYILNNEISEDASVFVKRELYDMKYDWYISQILMKENTLVDNNLLLIVFIGNENVGKVLLEKIIKYKSIQSFALGTCFRNEELYSKMKDVIISNFTNYALFISKEYGNDIIPSLMMYNKISNLIKFNNIIKLHTKTSDVKWFDDISNFLLANNIDELNSYKTDICNCIGPNDYLISLNDRDNINTIRIFEKYIDVNKKFVKGSMFYCDRIVFDKILDLISTNYKMFFNNNLYDINIINLLYSPIHTLERFFGIINI